MKKMENQQPPQCEGRCRALENYELCPSSKEDYVFKSTMDILVK